MSLLLDALHRASKDKEKTASAAVVPTPVAAEPRPAETWQLTADFSDRAFPVLLPPVPRPAVVANDAANPIALTLEFEPVPKPVSESELSLPPVSSPAQTPDPAPKHAVQAEAVKLLGAKPTAASPPIEAPAAKKPESAPAPPARAAQDIRRAYASTTPYNSGGRRRLIILGGVAGVLALVIGSVFSGLWGDPEKILGLSGQSSISTVALPPPAAPAVPQSEGAASQAPAVPVTSAAALPTETLAKSSPVAVPAHATPAEKSITAVYSAKPAATSVTVPVASVVVIQPSSRALSGDVVPRPAVASKAPSSIRSNVSQTLELGYEALLEGRLDDAAQAYGEALVANPDESDALLGMAYIHHKKGRLEQAQDGYRKVLRQDPANATAQSGLLALDSVSDTTLNAGRARELAARQPGSAAAMATAGSALVRDGLLADAALAFAKAQVIEPGNPLHAYNHAVALDRLGQFAAALSQYETVINLWGGSTVTVRAFQIETVRQRAAQLRQALGNSGEKTK